LFVIVDKVVISFKLWFRINHGICRSNFLRDFSNDGYG